MNPAEALIAEFPPGTPGKLLSDIPFVARSGLEALLVERGRAVLRLPFEPNINHVDMVYAGALFTLAEVPGGILFGRAFDMRRFYPVVGNVDLRFTRPALTSVLVDARMSDDEMERVAAELDSSGKAKYVLSWDLVDEHGAVVASATGTFFGRSY